MAIPVISVEEMRQWEARTWRQGITEEAVIDRVGQAIAEWLSERLNTGDHILVLAGKGHNGDDGIAAAKHLTPGTVKIIRVNDPSEAIDAVKAALNNKPRYVLDCLFGIGLNRPLSTDWCELINTLNQANREIISIDVPSGLNSSSGETMSTAVMATYTLTVGAAKAGLICEQSRNNVGYLRILSDVGLVAPPSEGELAFVEAADFESFPPGSNPSDHKGTRGHLVVVAGSEGYHGASVLATRAAMRVQPGLISLWTMPETYLPVASQLQQAMVHPWRPGFQLPHKSTALLLGPGLASEKAQEATADWAAEQWRTAELPLIVDASALAWIPPGNTKVTSEFPRIITPHPGEAARLLGKSTSEIAVDRAAALRELSEMFGNCWVILKGTHTMVGRKSGRILLNQNGNPGLAQGGSGDVLAGIVAGLIAQPRNLKNIERTLSFAVFAHGKAADQLARQRRNWLVEELPGAIRFE
jgi:ADP-dependent NAD(P)H-hydrate dehydratase / NAD(P)H-hydrate epimerase